ncbi:MAG: hypothetical protein QM831_31680 [Kofleriaceae bacterium]
MPDLPPPAFVAIDSFDDQTRAGAELSLGNALGAQVHAQYVDAPTGFGGYLQMPFAFASSMGDTQSAIGALEVGALYLPRFDIQHFKLVTRAGLTLPTTSSDAAPIALARQQDIANLNDYEPRNISLRLSVSPIVYAGRFFARGDLGVDINLARYEDFDSRQNTLYRVDAGVGVMFASLAVMAELATISADGNWAHSATLSARYDAGPVQPYIAGMIGLDGGGSASLTVGIDVPLRQI